MRKRLVDNHVLWEQGTIVEHLLKSEPDTLENIDHLNDDILEWWLVTPFLSKLLREQSETVLQSHECHWWGRTTSGQALYMDSVITQICRKIE